MKRLQTVILLLCLGVNCAMAQAQTCTDAIAANTPGKWKTSSLYVNFDRMDGIPPKGYAENKPRMLSVMDTLKRLVRKALPQLVGIDATEVPNIWAASEVDSLHSSYEWFTHYFDYYCSSRGLTRAHETSTNLRIGVNTLRQENFLSEQHDFKSIGVPVFAVPPPAGYVQGFPCYQMYANGEDPRIWTERYAVLVTRSPQERPFIPYTKREFYGLVHKLLETERANVKEGIMRYTRIRPRAELEASLQKQLDEIDRGNYGQDAKNARKRRLKEDFRTDEQLRDEKLQQVDKQYDGYLLRLDEMERTFKNELDRPVFVKDWFTLNTLNTSYNNQHLFNDSLKGYMIVKLNPAYFRKSAPLWRPQWILVTWKRQNGYAFSRNLETLWRNKLDFAALHDMLVK